MNINYSVTNLTSFSISQWHQNTTSIKDTWDALIMVELFCQREAENTLTRLLGIEGWWHYRLLDFCSVITLCFHQENSKSFENFYNACSYSTIFQCMPSCLSSQCVIDLFIWLHIPCSVTSIAIIIFHEICTNTVNLCSSNMVLLKKRHTWHTTSHE